MVSVAWDEISGQIQLDHPVEEGVLLLGLVAAQARGNLKAVLVLLLSPLGLVDGLEQLPDGLPGAVNDLLL